jgi:hypothetical protein
MFTDRQMDAARATVARDAAAHGRPTPASVNLMSNWAIFKSAFHKDNPLHQHNRRWGGARAVRDSVLQMGVRPAMMPSFAFAREKSAARARLLRSLACALARALAPRSRIASQRAGVHSLRAPSKMLQR